MSTKKTKQQLQAEKREIEQTIMELKSDLLEALADDETEPMISFYEWRLTEEAGRLQNCVALLEEITAAENASFPNVDSPSKVIHDFSSVLRPVEPSGVQSPRPPAASAEPEAHPAAHPLPFPQPHTSSLHDIAHILATAFPQTSTFATEPTPRFHTHRFKVRVMSEVILLKAAKRYELETMVVIRRFDRPFFGVIYDDCVGTGTDDNGIILRAASPEECLMFKAHWNLQHQCLRLLCGATNDDLGPGALLSEVDLLGFEVSVDGSLVVVSYKGTHDRPAATRTAERLSWKFNRNVQLLQLAAATVADQSSTVGVKRLRDDEELHIPPAAWCANTSSSSDVLKDIYLLSTTTGMEWDWDTAFRRYLPAPATGNPTVLNSELISSYLVWERSKERAAAEGLEFDTVVFLIEGSRELVWNPGTNHYQYSSEPVSVQIRFMVETYLGLVQRREWCLPGLKKMLPEQCRGWEWNAESGFAAQQTTSNILCLEDERTIWTVNQFHRWYIQATEVFDC